MPQTHITVKDVTKIAAPDAAKNMRDEIQSALALVELERYLKRLRRYGKGYRRSTWISDIRNGLGMSASQLARRMGVKQSTLTALEKSEREGTLHLASLRRAAAALECELVYAIVPPRSMSDMRFRRRRKVAEQMLIAADADFARRGLLERFAAIDAQAKLIEAGRVWE